MISTSTSTSTFLDITHEPVRFTPPKGSVDCHTHVFGPGDSFPWDPRRSYTPGDASIEDLNGLHKHLGIDKVVIVHPSPYGADNACTVNALELLGLERARGVAVIDPSTTHSELKHMQSVGVRGVRINLETYGLKDPQAALQMLLHTEKQVSPVGWHIQIFTRLAVLVSLAEHIKKLAVPLVIDHFCLIDPDLGLSQPGLEVLQELLESGKVWLKLSAPYRITKTPDSSEVKELARYLISANPNRVVWGTDWPHPGGVKHGQPRSRDVIEPFQPINNGVALNRLQGWTRSEDELLKILVTNPTHLYGF